MQPSSRALAEGFLVYHAMAPRMMLRRPSLPRSHRMEKRFGFRRSGITACDVDWRGVSHGGPPFVRKRRPRQKRATSSKTKTSICCRPSCNGNVHVDMHSVGARRCCRSYRAKFTERLKANDPTARRTLQPGQTTTSRARLNPLPLCANSAPSCAPLRHVLSAVSSVVALALSGI